MWEPYLRDELPGPTEDDRARLEALARGPLPPGCWELAAAHQGDALDQDLVQDRAFEAFILLLVPPAERLEKADASYSIASAMVKTMPRYQAGLLPFADDTGGNLWAFDYRTNPAVPSIVFIDHELEGDKGVTAIAPDFASLLAFPVNEDRLAIRSMHNARRLGSSRFRLSGRFEIEERSGTAAKKRYQAAYV